MTDNISVPRELLEILCEMGDDAMHMMGPYLADKHNERRFVDEARALLAAKAPAVEGEGLELDRNEAFQECPASGCDWGAFWLGWKSRHTKARAIIDQQTARIAELKAAIVFAYQIISHHGWTNEESEFVGVIAALAKEANKP